MLQMSKRDPTDIDLHGGRWKGLSQIFRKADPQMIVRRVGLQAPYSGRIGPASERHRAVGLTARRVDASTLDGVPNPAGGSLGQAWARNRGTSTFDDQAEL
jgi:hypothetical protein